MADGADWSSPIIRRPMDIVKIKLTPEMQLMVNDVDEFRKNENIYQQYGRNFRKGYLVYGKPGTGKTSMTKLIARKFGMTIYMIDLNSNLMTDNTLIKLISSVPPFSIIVFDEIDRQFDAMEKNKNKFITIGGIFSALDGPIPLSHGTIVIATANNRKFLNDADDKSMFRKGRIVTQFEFKTLFGSDIDDPQQFNNLLTNKETKAEKEEQYEELDHLDTIKDLHNTLKNNNYSMTRETQVATDDEIRDEMESIRVRY